MISGCMFDILYMGIGHLGHEETIIYQKSIVYMLYDMPGLWAIHTS